MLTAESVQQAVKQLPPAELAKFRRWYARFDANVRDVQVEADATAGKLGAPVTDIRGEMTEAMNRVVDQLGETRPDPFLTASARRVLERIEW